MKGKEIVKNIAKAKMPDREKIRKNCHKQAAEKSVNYLNIRIRKISVCACAAVVIITVFALGMNGLFTTPPIIDDEPFSAQPRIIEPLDSDIGVYVPAIKLPENAGATAQADIIGLFVYQERVYTQTAWYYNENASVINNLVGEHIGYTKGNINEWSKQEEFAVEFAGSVMGDVYTVNGYNPQFRLCMKGSYKDDGGNDIQYVNFYENLNDIYLTNGSDLFEDRLMLRDNWKQVKYQRHDDWNYHNMKFYDLPKISDTCINAFIDELYAGKFEYVNETVGEDFYDSKRKQAHLFFCMNDNTTIELSLFEGGYVGYRHLSWYFVKMPGEAFNAIFNMVSK